MNKTILQLMAVLAFAGSSASAYSALITYSYTGTVSQVFEAECRAGGLDGCDGYNFAYPDSSSFFTGHTFAVGDTFEGLFTYDTNARLIGITDDGYQAVYINAVVDHALVLGSYKPPSAEMPSTGNGSLSVVDGRYGSDIFQAGSYYGTTEWFSHITISLLDSTGTIYSGFDVPVTLDPDDFSYLGFQLAFLEHSSGDQLQIAGNLSSLVAVQDSFPVPVPATFALFAIGLACLGIQRRRKHLSRCRRKQAGDW